MKKLLPLLLLVPSQAFARDELCTIFDATCSTYEEWVTQVWQWAMGTIIGLSVVVLCWAAFIYMTSEGDPKKVEMSKRYIWGVVWGLGLLILARVLLVNVLGLGEGVNGGWNIIN